MSTPSRRALLASLGAAGSTALAGCSNPFGRTDCAVGDLLAGDWSQEGGGPAHAGRGTGSGPENGRIAWRVGLGEDRAVGSLAYADGVLYAGGSRIVDRERVGSLHALDAATGATEWTATPPGEPHGTPAITDDRILVTSRPIDPESGFLTAYDHAGEEVWRVPFDTRLTAAPTVHEGVVYLGLWDGTVRAYDVADGTEHWRVRFADERQPGTVYDAVAVADGRLFVAVDTSREAGLYALAPGDGRTLWRGLQGSRFRSAPSVADGRVAVSTLRGQTRVVDAATGEFDWSVGTSGRWGGLLAFGSDAAYLAEESVYALDAADGDQRWRIDSEVRARSRPTVGDGTVFAPGRDGVVALDADDGEVRWRFRGDLTTDAVLAGEVLFVGQPDGRVTALADC